MSYWVSLSQDGEIVSVPTHTAGGVVTAGGSTEAHINITYNYAKQIYQGFIHSKLALVRGIHDLRDLNGKKASDVYPALAEAQYWLGQEQEKDYWATTPGNAGYTLGILAKWAMLYPDAIFEVD